MLLSAPPQPLAVQELLLLHPVNRLSPAPLRAARELLQQLALLQPLVMPAYAPRDAADMSVEGTNSEPVS